MTSAAGNPQQFAFLKGGEDVLAPKGSENFDWDRSAAKVREHFHDALNAKNLAFLFGSGCSSMVRNDEQLGIDTMGPLAAEFLRRFKETATLEKALDAPDALPSTVSAETPDGSAKQAKPVDAPSVMPDGDAMNNDVEDRTALLEHFGLDIAGPEFANNLERLMEVLHSFQFVLGKSDNANLVKVREPVKRLIKQVTKFVTDKCADGKFSAGDDTLVRLYQVFYRKLSYRDRTLPRPWVFTTNYDLFSETALDRLGIPYCNGFSGVVERRFNPTSFRYALAEQLDVTSRKWVAVDNFVYLCKLHGSINWIEDGSSLFPVREVSAEQAKHSERVMIYPTPMKQNASFGSPYSDLFREFQSKMVREQTVLFVVGYSFGDEHVNNIIFQALTIPTFRLVVMLPPDATGVPAKLRNLRDPRVWFIGGEGKEKSAKAHFFETFVDSFMPEAPGDKVDEAVERVLRELITRAGPAASSDDAA
ncbi:SIR2 family protein [Luteibacter sp.]|uniref:SIR2 family protein n=1 Tax=Luteibacter sp. TaxID=1886636 RepID=UPI002F3FDB5C